MNVRFPHENWSDLPIRLRDAVLRKLVERRRRIGAETAARLLKADGAEAVPASLEQEFFLRQQQTFAGRLAWTIAAPPIVLEHVDPDRVRHALDALTRRHDALHMTFRETDEGFRIRLNPDAAAPFVQTQLPLKAALTGAERWLRQRYDQLLAEPFDAQAGPLWRAELVSRGGSGVLLMTFCSVIADGESLHLVERDLSALLAGDELPEPAFGYSDYAYSQARFARAGRFDGAMAWWRERLAGGPPSSWRDGREPTAPAMLYEQIIGPGTGLALDAYAAANHTTPHTVLLTEFMGVLRDLDRDDDLWVASATAARGVPGADEIVGTFARQMLLRHAWPASGDPLAGVHAMLAETMDQDPVPHLLVRQAIEQADPGGPSPFRYVFNHRLVDPTSGEADETWDVAFRIGPKLAAAEREEDILLMVMQAGERRRLHWYLRADRFDAEKARRVLGRFLVSLHDRLGLRGA